MRQAIWENINGQLFPLVIIGIGMAVVLFICFIDWLIQQIDSRRPHPSVRDRGFMVIAREKPDK